MKPTLLFCSLIALSLSLAACGSRPAQPTPAAPTAGATLTPSLPSVTPSATPDLCTQANLPQAVKFVNSFVHQFDNYSSVAFQLHYLPNNPNPAISSPIEQLPELIAAMKGIREALKQLAVPPCLTTLKRYALQYMDSVVTAAATYESTRSLEGLSVGIEQARKYNDQYAIELARLLGVTLGPPNGTPEAQVTDTPGVTTVLNPGPNPLNLHVSPSLTSQSIGLLNANETVPALAKSADGEWIQIEVPGQPGTKAWVYASLLQYASGDASVLPVATP